MITRPLDLASRLRPEPRNFDALFYVNVGVLVLFFALFGSHFVLAPGLGVNFSLPKVAGANANAKPPTHVVSVLATGQILTSHGDRQISELEPWFRQQVRGVKDPILLVRGDTSVPIATVGAISSAAMNAGFVDVLWAASEPASAQRSGGR
jgi:biopolymer transport protein ExbD